MIQPPLNKNFHLYKINTIGMIADHVNETRGKSLNLPNPYFSNWDPEAKLDILGQINGLKKNKINWILYYWVN